MRFLWLLLIISSNLWAQCLETWTEVPPFYIYAPNETTREYVFTGEQIQQTGILTPGKSTVGKVHDTSSKESPYRIIRKNTVVRTEVKYPLDLSTAMIPVEILSTPEDELNGLMGVSRNDKNTSLTQVNEKGFVSPRSLKKVSDGDVLMVTKDTVMLKDVNNLSSLVLKYGEGLRPVKKENSYKALDCSGKISYVFQVVSPNDNNLKEVQLDDDSCLDQQILSESNYLSIKRLLNFMDQTKFNTPIEVNEWGLSRLKTYPDDSLLHFTGTDREKTDDWATPDALCSLIEVASMWRENCSGPGCTLQIGDMGFPTPTRMANGKDALGHLQHSDGSCIDMRPFRKDQTMEGVNLDHNPQDYDHGRTQEFMNLLLKAGATPVYFNDPKISRSSSPGRKRQTCDLVNSKNDEKKGVFNCEGHSHHIHFCFRKPHAKGCG